MTYLEALEIEADAIRKYAEEETNPQMKIELGKMLWRILEMIADEEEAQKKIKKTS